jgi:hypothetical protein
MESIGGTLVIWSGLLLIFQRPARQNTRSIHRHPFAFRDPSPQTVERINAIVDYERYIAKQRVWRSAGDTEFPCRFDFAARAKHGR